MKLVERGALPPRTVSRAVQIELRRVTKQRDDLIASLKRIAALPDVHFDFVLGSRGSGEDRGGKMNDPATCPGCIAEDALKGGSK